MSRVGSVSASGLRPAGAFAAIACVLVAVGAKAAHIALAAEGSQPSSQAAIRAPRPDFEISDRHGRPLAVSVESFDLSLSPQSMWRSHTPLRIAELLAEVLADDTDDWEREATMLELSDGMLPAEASAGEILTREDGLLVFDLDHVQRVATWIQSGRVPSAEEPAPEQPRSPAASAEPALPGMRLVPLAETGPWVLAWQPVVTLDESTRRALMDGDDWKRPSLWTRRLLRDLARLIDPKVVPDDLHHRLAALTTSARDEELCEAIWQELMPSQYRRLCSRMDPDRAHRLNELLRAEAVSPWQMRLDPSLDRRHPLRPDSPALEGSAASDAFAVLGNWGVLGPEEAFARARREAGLSARDDYLNERQRRFVQVRAGELATEWHALSGLELVCSNLFAGGRYDFLEENRRLYERRLRSVPRDRRRAWSDRIPNYFGYAASASPVPRMVSTIDARLQRFVHTELERVLDTLDPALALALVVEVESGDVLAVDSVSQYPLAGFAPIHHQYTPGSTFKAIVMALALDMGLVQAGELFQTFAPSGILVYDEGGGGRGRRIREAEGAPEAAWVSASQGLAQSVNAVLVQVGLRIPPPVFRDSLHALGYGIAPGSGLGPERRGYLPRLKKGTWKRRFTHASVCIGHEIMVTPWQHAAALATLARGGGYRPLRTVQAVECEGQSWDVPLETAKAAVGQPATRVLREMLHLGATEGTGDRVASPEHCPEFYAPGATIGTKTGTTEKVESELCLHVELAHNASVHADGGSCPRECREDLKYRRDHRGHRSTCYTSSMLALGRPAADVPELMVLVVVEDARCELKFGADVAGPSAMAILRAAHGLDPLQPDDSGAVGVQSAQASMESGASRAPGDSRRAMESSAAWMHTESDSDTFNTRDFPWADGGGETP